MREEIGVEGERWGGEENGVGGQGGSEGRDRGGGETVGWRTVVEVEMKGMRLGLRTGLNIRVFG